MADRHVVMHDVQVSDEAEEAIKTHVEAIEAILRAEGERIADPGGFPQVSADLRWKLLVLGASIEDYVLWIQKEPGEGEWWTLTEVESTGSAQGVSPRDACERYFQ